jgi:fatty acid desaturase
VLRWKSKHNTHHALCNIHGDDPDIDTLPLIAWSEHALELFAELPGKKVANIFVGYQAWLYVPILLLARTSWLLQSVMWNMPFNLSPVKSPFYVHRPAFERTALIIHYTWLLLFVFTRFTLWQGLLYFAATQCFAGFLTGMVFSLNHNGRPIVSKEDSEKTDFFTLQVITSRDVICSPFVNWFTGGLNLQIEHHVSCRFDIPIS